MFQAYLTLRIAVDQFIVKDFAGLEAAELDLGS